MSDTAADHDQKAHGERDPAPAGTLAAPGGAPVAPRKAPPGYRADGSRPRTRKPSGGGGYRPAHGRYEPFGPGNSAALTHGAESPRMVEPLAAELVQGAVASSPYLTAPEFAGELAAWSRAEAKVILLSRWLAEHGQLDEDGNPRPAAEFLVRVERTAAERRHALGLTPMARARLGRDVTAARVDLAALWAEEDGEHGDDGEDGAHGWSELPA